MFCNSHVLTLCPFNLVVISYRFLLSFLFPVGERPFKCHICGKAFKQSSDLKKHVNLHTGTFQFKCEECNMEFRRGDALRKHKLGHEMGNNMIPGVTAKEKDLHAQQKEDKLSHITSTH